MLLSMRKSFSAILPFKIFAKLHSLHEVKRQESLSGGRKTALFCVSTTMGLGIPCLSNFEGLEKDAANITEPANAPFVSH